MKIMSRDFTNKEQILLVILALILVGLAYYYFVDQNVRSTITSADAECQQLQTELDAVQMKIAHLQSLQNAMDELEASGNLTWMGSYNNGKAEVAFLNDILADTLKYSVTFSNVTRNGNQIRRNFTLQYQTLDYLSAQNIMDRLNQGENRCVLGDVKCTMDADGRVTINQNATFFETMVGGTPDAGLPVDSATANR